MSDQVIMGFQWLFAGCFIAIISGITICFCNYRWTKKKGE